MKAESHFQPFSRVAYVSFSFFVPGINLMTLHLSGRCLCLLPKSPVLAFLTSPNLHVTPEKQRKCAQEFQAIHNSGCTFYCLEIDIIGKLALLIAY